MGHFTTTARIRAKAPSDPETRQKFTDALNAVASIFPADGPEPSRADVVAESAARIGAVGFSRIDTEDGTDFAETMADAYFAARVDFETRTRSEAGNA